MAEEQQVPKEPQQVTTKEPQQVTTKDPKKVEVGKRLAAHNHKKREAQNSKQGPTSKVSQYYDIGAVIAVGVIGGLGYYIYQTEKGQASGEVNMPHNPTVSQRPPHPKANKFEMD